MAYGAFAAEVVLAVAGIITLQRIMKTFQESVAGRREENV